MQQTENYKLNKPETSDPFTPAPLSENMDTVDAALADHEQRMVALEGCRIVIGVYKRYLTNYGSQIIDLGGRPAAVLVSGHNVSNAHITFVVGDETALNGSSSKVNLRIVDNGFEVFDLLTNNELSFCFMAFMGDYVPLDIPQYVP